MKDEKCGTKSAACDTKDGKMHNDNCSTSSKPKEEQKNKGAGCGCGTKK